MKADKSLKLSKLISRSSHAASAKSCLWKIFKYNYSKLNVVQELHCIVFSTAHDLVHKSKADQLETLLKESFRLCHCQPASSTDHDWSWMNPVHSLYIENRSMFTCLTMKACQLRAVMNRLHLCIAKQDLQHLQGRIKFTS